MPDQVNSRTQNAVKALQELFKNGNKGDSDKKLTRTEARIQLQKALDTNGDGSVDTYKDNESIQKLKDILNLDVDKVTITGVDPAQLKQALEVVKIAASDVVDKLPPPEPIKQITEDDPLFQQDIIRDPDKGVDQTYLDKFSGERTSRKGQDVVISGKETLDQIQSFIDSSGETDINKQADAVVKGIMENADSTGFRTLRLDELQGVLEYAKSNPEFKEAFLNAMVKYISSDSPENQQAFLNSMLGLYQSGDFTNCKETGDFLKEFIEKIATDASAFKDKDEGIVGYYDGTQDYQSGANYGSLALIKNADGAFEWRITDQPSSLNLIHYVYEGEEGSGSAPPEKGREVPPGAAPPPEVESTAPTGTTESAPETVSPIDAQLEGIRKLIQDIVQAQQNCIANPTDAEAKQKADELQLKLKAKIAELAKTATSEEDQKKVEKFFKEMTTS